MAAEKALGWLGQRQATVADPEVLHFTVTISKTLNLEIPFDITADVSTWFPRTEGNAHIRMVDPMYGSALDTSSNPQLRQIIAEQPGCARSDIRCKEAERTPSAFRH